MELFDKNNISLIQTLIDYLLSIWKEEGGYGYSVKNEIALHELLNLIKENQRQRAAVSFTLTQLKCSGKSSVDDFCRIYLIKKKEISRKKPVLKKWTFYIPIHAELDYGIKLPINLTILGKKYQFIKIIPHRNKLFKNFPIDLSNFEEHIRTHINSSKLFLKVTSYESDLLTAWQDVLLSFEVTRGIFEFSFGFRQFQKSLQCRPRSKVPFPKWVLFIDNDNSFDGFTFDVINYDFNSNFKFSQRHFTLVKNNARIFRAIPDNNSSKQILINCLRLYADATDGINYHYQFLSLWNIAETICLSDEFGGKSNEVAKRLAWFGKNLNLVSSGYTNILNSLAQKRNSFVHKGMADINEDDINHLKFAIDNAIIWLYKVAPHMGTSGLLKQYYKIKAITNTKEILAIKKAIQFINKF